MENFIQKSVDLIMLYCCSNITQASYMCKALGANVSKPQTFYLNMELSCIYRICEHKVELLEPLNKIVN